MTLKHIRRVILFLSLSLCLLPSLKAQTSGTGALSGTVTDSSGSAVPNVAVTIMSADTGQTRNATTGSDGYYKVGLLLPGNYRVKFEIDKFKTVEIPSVSVTVTETAVLNRQLEVGSQAQVITVVTTVESVETTNATVGSTISGTSVTALPLASRNYTNLLSLSAGANAKVTNAAELGKNTQETAVNGSESTQNNYQMDGASIVSYTGIGGVVENGSRSSFGIPNPDSIQEVKIQTSQYDAGYGRNPGANVNVVTKSGSNDFHGAVFEYFRNTSLNANDWFNKRTELQSGAPNVRGALNQNQYGGVFGGPVKKDKLFFFVSFQETAQKNGLSPAGQATSSIPAIPLGDRGTPAFQQALGATFCHAPTFFFKFFGGVQVACDGSNINPVALKILNLKIANGSYYIPSPNGASTAPGVTCGTVMVQLAFQCVALAPAIYHEHQGMGNWDYVINSKNILSGRYFFSTDPSVRQFYNGSTLPGAPSSPTFTNHEAVLKLTTVLTNNLVNEARISYQRNSTDAKTQSPFTDSQVRSGPSVAPDYDHLAQTLIGNLQFGTSIFSVTNNTANQYQWADQLSWTHGKHTVRTGVEIGHTNWNWNFIALENGFQIFRTTSDFLVGLPGCTPGDTVCFSGTPTTTLNGNGVAVPNNGTPFSNVFVEPGFVTRFSPGGSDFHFWSYDYSAFVQDDIKVTPRLTLNVGLRFEYDGYPSERAGKNVNVVPSLLQAGPPPLVAAPCPPFPASCPGSSLAGFTVPSNWPGAVPAGVVKLDHSYVTQSKTPRNNFAPRVGFAWQPLATNRFVVRGGVGIFYDLIAGENFIHGVLQSVPYAVTVGSNGLAPFNATLDVPYTNTSPNWIPRYVTASGLSSDIQQQGISANFPTPITYQWNLNVQYEFLPSLVVELGYVGTRGVHQNTPSQPINPALLQVPTFAPGQTTISTSNTFLRVPYLGFDPGFILNADSADSKYNSVQATVRKTVSHGLTFQAGYSFSRAFLSNWVGNPAIMDNSNTAFPIISQYGPGPEYHPHRFTFQYSWDIPVGSPTGIKGVLIAGWRLSGETTIQDGTPLTVNDGNLGSIFGAPVTSQAQFCPGMSRADAATHGRIQDRLNAYVNESAFCVGGVNAANVPVMPSLGTDPGGLGTGFGNSGQGILLGPGQHNWDMSLTKLTKVGGLRENATLEFRTEFFNAFNHPQFNNPSVSNASQQMNPVDLSAGGQNTITSMSVNPRLIQFALKYSF